MNEKQSISPLSPERAMEQKLSQLPDEVVEATNIILTENLVGAYGHVKVREIVALLGTVDFDTKTIRDKSWVHTLAARFQAEGWKVEVNIPSYDDNFESYISFTDPTRTRSK